MSEQEPAKPDAAADDSIGLITTVTVVVLAGGLVLPVLAGTMGHTAGAPSSMRLEQQRRAAEVQRVVAQYEADEQRRAERQDNP